MKSLADTLAARPSASNDDARHRSNRDKWIEATAKLIDRPFIAVKLMTKGWPEHLIERRYKEAMNCNREFTTPAIRWWSLRKRDMVK